MVSRFPAFSQSLAQEQTTRRIWYGLATVHDIEEYDSITEGQFYQQIFVSHFGQLAFIFPWISGILFHVAWQGNINTWGKNILRTVPIAHTIMDPHFSEIALAAFSNNSSNNPVNSANTGIYHWWFTIGMRTDKDLFIGAIFLLTTAIFFLVAAWIHSQRIPNIQWFKNAESRLNHHLAVLIGFSSLAWTGHIIHIAIPTARGQFIRWHNLLEAVPQKGLAPFFSGNWLIYSEKLQIKEALNAANGNEALLTFIGGLNPATGSLWLTDIAHHHPAIAILFITAGHMYRTNFGIGHSIQSLLEKHIPERSLLGFSHIDLHATISHSPNLQLALALAAISTITSLTAQHMYAMPAYAFISLDIVAQATLYTHHQYIAGFLMMGAFVHGSIFMAKDYNSKSASVNVLAKIINQKEAITSHLTWVCLLLGFHTLGLYVHNDTMIAFGSPEKQILIEPVFAQYIQSTHGKRFNGLGLLLSLPNTSAALASQNIWLPGWMDAINNASNPLFLNIGPGDFLIHHAIALGLHTTTLIAIKGALDARGSKLMPDKQEFGFSFPCDGPGRGGTCDIAAWDAFHLAFFWMLNTIGWVTFYWHWKHIAFWKGSDYQFNESSTYLMGWLRDYLWLYSAQLINGYASMGINTNTVWIWMFLFGHFVWALGFMFPISWRGYWQELIESLIWAHEQTPIANMLSWKEKPVALSIVQARLVGLSHFTAGYVLTYAAFIVSSTYGIEG